MWKWVANLNIENIGIINDCLLIPIVAVFNLTITSIFVKSNSRNDHGSVIVSGWLKNNWRDWIANLDLID